MAVVQLSEPEFLAEVERLVQGAEARGIPLRVCGSVGLYYRIRGDPLARELYRHRGGPPAEAVRFKDLDLAGFEKRSVDVYRFFVKELGFSEDTETNSLFGMIRNIYYHPAFQIDVFYDELRFSHRISLKGRFPPGIALAPEDLFLAKAQIHETTPRDLVDLAAFACAFPLERLDRAYLGRLLGEDWGLWYDVNENLCHAYGAATSVASSSDGALQKAVPLAHDRLRAYADFLRALPKTRRWEKRAAKGTSVPWFEEVDEVR